MRSDFIITRRQAPKLGVLATDNITDLGTGLSQPLTLVTPTEDLSVDPSALPVLPVAETAAPVDIAQATPGDTSTVPGAGYTNVQGDIIDAKTGAPVLGVTVTLVNSAGQTVNAPVTLTGSTYTAWSDDPNNTALLFKKSGYTDRLLYFNDVLYNPEVTLTPGGSFPYWALLFAVPLVFAGRKKKKVTGISGTVETAILVGGAVVLLPVILPLLNAGKNAAKGVSDVVNAAASALSQTTALLDPSQAALWGLAPAQQDYGDINKATANTTYPLNSVSWQYWNLNSGAGTGLHTVADCKAIGDALYSQKVFFIPNNSSLLQYFSVFTSKADVSFFAYRFMVDNSKNLFMFLLDNWNTTPVAELITFVNNLPDA